MKRLYLLRHAKSSWDHPGLADQERPLAPRGRRASAAIAAHIDGEGIEPAVVLCSPARRARETLERISDALPEDIEVSFEPELYGAGDEQLLERLRRLPDAVPSVLLIAHNPGMYQLAVRLAANGARLGDLRRKYPTAALATLEFPVARWGALEARGAELTGYVKPRELE